MFEVLCILAALGLYTVWLCTPSERVMSDQEKVQREAEAFKKALQDKWLIQQAEHGKRVEARKKANGNA